MPHACCHMSGTFLMRVFGVVWNIGKGVFILNIYYYYYLLGIQIAVTNVNINLSQDNRVKDSLKSCQKSQISTIELNLKDDHFS